MSSWNMGLLGAASALSGSYELIQTSLISTNTASVTFSSLNSANYRHLQVRLVVRAPQDGNNNVFLRFNGDATSSYRTHALYGSGSSVASFDNGLGTALYTWGYAGSSAAANAFSAQVIDILDFGSSSKNTTIRALVDNTTSNQVALTSGVWLNTAAVTSLTVQSGPTNFFAAGSRISLYGIKG